MCKYNDGEPERSKSFSFHLGKRTKMKKTINSRYSLVVTHPTTNLPAHGLSTAERTGSPVFHVLWSIAEEKARNAFIHLCKMKLKEKKKLFQSTKAPCLAEVDGDEEGLSFERPSRCKRKSKLQCSHKMGQWKSTERVN